MRFSLEQRKLYRSKLHRDYDLTFNTPHGRRVLHHLMRTGKVVTPVADPDPNQSLRNEGMQHLVLSILRFLKKRPDQIAETTEEAIQKEYE